MNSGKLQNISSYGGLFDHYIGLMYSDGEFEQGYFKKLKALGDQPWGC